MTVVAESVVDKKLVARSSRRGFAELVFPLLCIGLYLLPFMRIVLKGTDEGTVLYGAVRIAHGQVFARDFFEVIGPGSFYLQALYFKMFGITFLATRVSLFLTSLISVSAVYYLSSKVCKEFRALPCILILGVSFGGMFPTVSHHLDSNLF